MELTKIAELFNGITNIPAAILGEAGIEAEYGIRSFKPNPAEFYARSILNRSTEREVDVTLSEDLVICGFVVEVKHHKALVLGPVMEHPCTRHAALAILKRMELPYKRADELLAYFEKIPNVPLSYFIRSLYFLHYIINDTLPPEEEWYDQTLRRLDQGRRLEVPAVKAVHNPPEWDQELLSCVEFGRVEEMEDCLRRMKTEGRMGITAENSLRSLKNVVISSVTLVSRAAIRGGMEYESALSLSDDFIRKLETLNTYEDVLQLIGECFYEYTGTVAQLRALGRGSKLVSAVFAYIRNHISEPIQVSEMAEALGHNVSYLCRCFKRETGKTLKEYIGEVKLDAAKFLLRSTEKSVVSISMELGYSSQAYFTTQFREYTGETPVAYRNKYR